MKNRSILTVLAAVLLTPIPGSAQAESTNSPETAGRAAQGSKAAQAAHDARMEWWHDAKFGMFIHWGLYAIPGRGEKVMNRETYSVAKYAELAKQFNPVKFNAE